MIMTNILIVEDEPQAAARLEQLLQTIMPDLNVLAKLESVKQSVRWLKANSSPALIFMDIQLGDGISFDIFNQVEVKCPVIFTTAYDEYALKAFKVNSIDYILKPLDQNEVKQAMQKFKRLGETQNTMTESISIAMEMLSKKYKSRFIIKVGERLRSVEVQDILFFFSEEKTTFALTQDGRKHIIDYNMDQLEALLDPNNFFRINRQYIISTHSILEMFSHTNSRLKLILKSSNDKEIIVARERVQDFKAWLDQ
jgi:DNA-binding LytR/AlgR family response regulator